MAGPIGDIFRAAVGPGRTARKWLAEPRALGRGLRAVAVVGGLYASTALGLALAGAVPLAPPFLDYPDDNYYFWQMILILPGFILSWLLASGLVRLFGGRLGGRRNLLRSAASLAGPSLAVPLLIAWLPQAAQTVLMLFGMGQEEFVEIVSAPGIWQIVFVAVYAVAGLLAVFLFARATRISQSVGGGMSWIAGFFVAAMTGILFVFFVR